MSKNEDSYPYPITGNREQIAHRLAGVIVERDELLEAAREILDGTLPGDINEDGIPYLREIVERMDAGPPKPRLAKREREG